MTRWRARHRGPRSERGAAAVEFAIVLVVLLVILLGIIDFGRLLFVSQAVKSASREGARVAAVRTVWGGTTSPTASTAAGTPTGVVLTVRDAGDAARALAGDSDLTVSYSGNPAIAGVAQNAPLCTGVANSNVTINVSTTFTWLTPVGALAGGGFGGAKDVASSTTMRCE